ncbi:MAG: HNH endonuclease [Saprospiraceae bacterium]|nr:HNH endonuclease [Saprospiraceae bacterium]
MRAGFRCEYCKAPKAYAPSPFTIDHIVPEILGGSSELDNLAYACENCNGGKHTSTHATDPDTGLEVALFHPRKDRWADHFAWQENDINVKGLTPVGRATVAAMHLNHRAVVNMRILLKMVGEHPPKETL